MRIKVYYFTFLRASKCPLVHFYALKNVLLHVFMFIEMYVLADVTYIQ